MLDTPGPSLEVVETRRPGVSEEGRRESPESWESRQGLARTGKE